MSDDKERDQFARDIAQSAAAQRSVDAAAGAPAPVVAPPPSPEIPGGDDTAETVALADAMNRRANGGQPVVDPRQAQLRAAQAGLVGPFANQADQAATNAAAYPGAAGAPQLGAPRPPQPGVPPPGAPIRATPQPGQQGGPALSSPLPGQLGATYDAQGRAVQAGADAQNAANSAQVVGDAQVGQEQRDQAAAQQQRAQDEAQATQRQLDDIHRMSDDAAKMGVDPSHWWHNQGTGDKVRYTIAAMLGGFAAGWTHGPNLAMNQINKYIDDDINAQKTAIEQAHGHVSDARGVLGEMYQRYGNLDKAAAATGILKLNAMINDTKAQVAAAGAGVNQANADITLAGLQRAKLEQQAKFMAAPSTNVAALGKLSEEYGKAGIPEAQNAIDKVAGIAAQPDPAGFGLFSRAAHALGADWMIPQEGLNNRAAVDQAVLKIAHATGRVTPQEIEAVRRGYLGAVENPAALKQFVEGVQSEINAKRANIQGGANPQTVRDQEALDKAWARRAGGGPKAGLPSGSTP